MTGKVQDMLALDDGALAIVLIAATRFERDADRVRLLERFAERADPSGRRTTNIAPGRRPRAGRRSPAAEKQRRYRERLRREVALIPVPVTRAIVSYLVRSGLLRDREVHERAEIGAAIAAALERAARADR
jgi:hypothetical protein